MSTGESILIPDEAPAPARPNPDMRPDSWPPLSEKRSPFDNEERLRLALGVTGLGLWDVDVATGQRSWSEGMRSILGLSSNVPADPAYFSTLIHPEDRDRINALYASAYDPRGDGRYRAEFRILRASDGVERWVLTTGHVFFDGQRRPVRALGTLQDVTERRSVEAALRESEERLNLALAAGGLGTWDLDLDRSRRIFSPRSAEIMGVRPEDVAAREAWTRYVHPDDQEHCRAALQDAIDRNAPYQVEFRVRLPAGGERWVASQAIIQRDETGRPRRVIGIHQDITARRLAEEALKASEGRFRGVFQSRIAGLTIFDANTGSTLIMNDRMLDIVGRSRESFERGEWNCYSISPPEHLHLDDDAVAQARTRGWWEPFQKEYLRPDGTRVPVQVSSAPLPGEPGRVVVSVEDITERRSAREALEASEARFRALAETTPQLVWSTRADGACDYLSPQWLSYTGQDGGSTGGWHEAIHPEERTAVLAAWAEALKEEKPFDSEHRLRRHDGGYRWFKARASALRDEAGRVIRWFGAATDIDEIVEARDSLRESEQRLRATQDHAGVGIIEVDQEGRILRANEAYCAITGYDREELRNFTLWDLTHPDDILLDRLRLEEQVRDGRSGTGTSEKRLLRKCGELRWVAVSSTAVRDPHGRFLYGVRVVQDITERRQHEESQRLLLHELNHRVKNTLATVQSIAAQTLRTAPTPEDFGKRFTSRIVALSQTHNLLTEERWEGAALRGLIEKELEPFTGSGGARIALSGSPVRVGPQAAVALGLIFHELTTNAAKYGALSAPEGMVRIEWAVDRSVSPPRLALTWSESGGPPVEPPTRRGFGSRLIDRSVGHELGGKVQLDFAVTGLCCRLEVPLGP